jgi:type IV pilus assembly protein PilY1
MKTTTNDYIKYFLLLAIVFLFAIPGLSKAAPATGPINLTTEPLVTLPASSTGQSVKPNVLFVLDTSGSMDWSHMPDDSRDGGSSVAFGFGYYGARSSQCNQIYYNPNVTYEPPVDADGNLYPNSSFTAAKRDGFDTSSGTINLSTEFKALDHSTTLQEDNDEQAAYYYVYSGSETTQTKKRYHDNTSPFFSECGNNTESKAGFSIDSNRAYGIGPDTGVSGKFTKVTLSSATHTAAELTNFANWYTYYRTRMLMMKTSAGKAFAKLTGKYRVGLMKLNDSAPTVPLGVFASPSSHRDNWYDKLYKADPSGGTPLRSALSNAGYYYAGKLSGTDPVEYSCQQNFTILSTDGYWNSGDGYDLSGGDVGNQDGTAARPMYDGAQASTSYTTPYTRYVYDKSGNGCWGSNKRLRTRTQEQSCTVIGSNSNCTSWTTTNTTYTGSCASSGSISVPSPSTTAAIAGATVATAGTSGGSEDTLADIAMYYYETDLRPGTCTLCTDNVFTSGKDNNTQQHMTTFTLGLGASGYMNYNLGYDTAGSGDFFSVKQGSTASATVCTWQATGTVCNWPLPGMSGSDGLISNIDDLWHAGVNGRGAYYSATDPETLATGLSNALSSLDERRGAAAAAATSTLNPVAGNNSAFVASYSTVSWKGNLESRSINVDTGLVNENADWCVETIPADTCDAPSFLQEDTAGDASAWYCVTPGANSCANGILDGTDCKVPVATACTGTMTAMVTDTTDTRKIWTSGANATTLNNFKLPVDGGDLNPADFNATKLAGLTQWASYVVDAAATPAVNQPTDAVASIVDYLRGQKGKEFSKGYPDDLFRSRDATLGDAIESQPAYIAAPTFKYVDTGYDAFKTANASRGGTIYIGSNDGMLHAFNASNGNERWAFVPSMVIPKLWKLADRDYAINHEYYVNGSPVISDIYDGSSWKTILVAGLNGGGRGYYALDITNPAAPVHLWDFSPAQDTDLGFSFGRPVVTKKADGTWVVLVTSGYNNGSTDGAGNANSPAGNGKGYLYVLNANTGAKISKIATATGTASIPSGLAQISAYASDGEKNNEAVFVYGGDLLGNLWRFDINAGSVVKFAVLKDSNGGSAQPITTKPEIGNVLASNGLHRVVYVGTGQYLSEDDLTDTQIQTIYAIKDDDLPGSTGTTTLDAHATSALVQQTFTVSSTQRVATSPAQTVNFATQRGWLVDFPAGERINVAPQLVQGTLLVPTTVPSNTVCSPGGESWLNFFDYRNGGAVGSGGVVGVKASGLIVGMNVFYITDPVTGKIVPKVNVVTGLDPTPKLVPDPVFSTSGSGFQKKRAIWRELIE